MTASESIIYKEVDGIGVLTVNRPEARNALNWEAQRGFAAIVDRLAQTEERPHVLIITGAGKKGFISGGDLNELAALPEPQTGVRLRQTMLNTLNQLEQLPIIVIGAAQGHAAGGGVEVLAACDLRIADRQAKFHFVQAKMGLTTGWGGVGRLIHLIGRSQTMRLMLSASSIDTAEAKAIGFLHRIADLEPEEHIVESARAWAEELCKLPHDAQLALKQLIRFNPSPSMPDIQAQEAAHFLALFGRGNNKEALSAFKEKRPPVFNQH